MTSSFYAAMHSQHEVLLGIIRQSDLFTLCALTRVCRLTAQITRQYAGVIASMPLVQTVAQEHRLIKYTLINGAGGMWQGYDYPLLRREISRCLEREWPDAASDEFICITSSISSSSRFVPFVLWVYWGSLQPHIHRYCQMVRLASDGRVWISADHPTLEFMVMHVHGLWSAYERVIWGGCPCETCMGVANK
jgi:hypothetical protein